MFFGYSIGKLVTTLINMPTCPSATAG